MKEDWMMLNNWGEPIPETMLEGMERTEMDVDTVRRSYATSNESLKKRVEEFLGKYVEGDTLLWVNSPQSDWDRLMGHQGYVLLRQSYFVDELTLRMN